MNRIAIFARLGERMAQLTADDKVVRRAVEANPWFRPHEVVRAAQALASALLRREVLEEWMAHYPTLPTTSPERVLIVMAGNIPWVGFFDLLCVMMAGHRALVKPSSKDRATMEWVVEQLLAEGLAIEWYDGGPIDRLIATGSNETAAHFRRAYPSTRSLLRGSRQSVALLRGDESPEEWKALSNDCFAYSGLGCRNVSLLLAPQGAEIHLQVPPMGDCFEENYRQQRALKMLLGEPFTDLGGALLVEGEEFPTALSTVVVKRYTALPEAEEWIARHREEIQCVVSRHGNPRFGRAQQPGPFDYADGVDTMAFLANEQENFE